MSLPPLPSTPIMSINWADQSKTTALYTEQQMLDYANAAQHEAAELIAWALLNPWQVAHVSKRWYAVTGEVEITECDNALDAVRAAYNFATR